MGKNQKPRGSIPPAQSRPSAAPPPEPASASVPVATGAPTTPPIPRRAALVPPAGPPVPWLWGKLFLIGLGLGLLALAAYGNSFHAGLVLDNSVVIESDPRIRAVTSDNLFLILHRNYWWPAFESDLYRPLTTLSYLLNYRLFSNGAIDKFDQASVPSFHWVNFLLQWANVWLVLVLVRRLSQRLELAVVAAALFAVHPVNVESITNIVGRADLLVSLSILLSGWCYLRAAEAVGWRKVAWLAGTGLNALWGIFAKESAVLVCAFVFLYDLLWRWPLLPEKDFFGRLKRAAVEFGLKGYVALLPALLALWLVRSWLIFHSPVFGQVFVDNPISGADNWFQGAMTAINVLGRYLLLLIFPRTLSPDYSYHQIPLYGEPGAGWQDLLSWVSLVAVIALIWLAVRWRRRQPLYSWGVGVFFLMQLPTMNLLFPIGSIMGERFLYFSSVGFCAVAALGLWEAVAFCSRRFPALGSSAQAAGWILAAAATVGLAARTYARNADWQTEYSLWKSTVAAVPDSFKSHKGFANSLWGDALEKYRGDWVKEEQALDAAIVEAEKGLAILDQTPLSLPKQDNTLFKDLGMFYLYKGEHLEHRGQVDEARAFYQKGVDVLMRAVEVDHYANKTSREVSLKRGRPESEIADVGNFNVYTLLVLVYQQMKDWPKAEAAARYVQRLVPLNTVGYRLTAEALAQQGRVPDAAVQILEALLLDPNDGSLFQSLGACYAAMRIIPNPVEPYGNTFKLDQSVPLVRQELNEAGVELIQRVEEGKEFDTADALRKKFIALYQIPAELLIKK